MNRILSIPSISLRNALGQRGNRPNTATLLNCGRPAGSTITLPTQTSKLYQYFPAPPMTMVGEICGLQDVSNRVCLVHLVFYCEPCKRFVPVCSSCLMQPRRTTERCFCSYHTLLGALVHFLLFIVGGCITIRFYLFGLLYDFVLDYYVNNNFLWLMMHHAGVQCHELYSLFVN